MTIVMVAFSLNIHQFLKGGGVRKNFSRTDFSSDICFVIMCPNYYMSCQVFSMKSIDVFYMNLRYLSVIISSKNSGTFWVIHSLVFHVVNDQYGKIDSFVDDCKIILGSNKNLYKQSREVPKF